MMIDIHQLGWVGCALAFLALCKVGFVSGFCVPCNVLKIAWGRVAKSWVFNVQNSNRVALLAAVLWGVNYKAKINPK